MAYDIETYEGTDGSNKMIRQNFITIRGNDVRAIRTARIITGGTTPTMSDDPVLELLVNGVWVQLFTETTAAAAEAAVRIVQFLKWNSPEDTPIAETTVITPPDDQVYIDPVTDQPVDPKSPKDDPVKPPKDNKDVPA